MKLDVTDSKNVEEVVKVPKSEITVENAAVNRPGMVGELGMVKSLISGHHPMCFQIHKAIYPVYRSKDPQNHKCFQDVVDDASKQFSGLQHFYIYIFQGVLSYSSLHYWECYYPKGCLACHVVGLSLIDHDP